MGFAKLLDYRTNPFFPFLRIAGLLVCLSISLLIPKGAFADSIDLEIVPGKGVVGYMEFGMSVEDLIALAESVGVSERNFYYYHSGTKKVETASTIEMEEIGVATTFSFFEDGRGLVRKVLSVDIDLRKGQRRGRLIFNFMSRGRLDLDLMTTQEQIIKFMNQYSENSNQAKYRHFVYGSNNELESLYFDEEGLLYCFSSNKLINIRMNKEKGCVSAEKEKSQPVHCSILNHAGVR